jgi:hypothetical protein
MTGRCLTEFDTDGAPIVIAGTKLTSKGRVEKGYETPFGDRGRNRGLAPAPPSEPDGRFSRIRLSG